MRYISSHPHPEIPVHRVPREYGKFYAVANGKANGVFTDWREVEPLIRDMRSAKFKRWVQRPVAR